MMGFLKHFFPLFLELLLYEAEIKSAASDWEKHGRNASAQVLRTVII